MTNLINKIVPEAFNIVGLRFHDDESDRDMMYVYPKTLHWSAGHILFRALDGQWTVLRKATDRDLEILNDAVAKGHHA